jgi:hypothetical protein
VRLHRYRGLSRWIPKALLELWSEIHPGQPLQLQLAFAVSARAARAKVELARTGEASSQGLFFAMAVKCRGAPISCSLELS